VTKGGLDDGKLPVLANHARYARSDRKPARVFSCRGPVRGCGGDGDGGLVGGEKGAVQVQGFDLHQSRDLRQLQGIRGLQIATKNENGLRSPALSSRGGEGVRNAVGSWVRIKSG